MASRLRKFLAGSAVSPAQGKECVKELHTMINAQEIQGQWNRIRGELKRRWAQLTDDDLMMQSGNVDQLVGRIQAKTGEGREAIERFLGDLTSRGSSGVTHAADAVRDFAQNAGSYVHGASDRLREGYGQIADVARERFDRAEDVVRHNPAESVAAAFGIGLMVGLAVGLAIRLR
jgi:uncharacterized protein YjbJ (UPF0337 family)